MGACIHKYTHGPHVKTIRNLKRETLELTDIVKQMGTADIYPTILLRKTRESKPSSQQLTRLSPKLATYPVTKQKERLYPFRVR